MKTIRCLIMLVPLFLTGSMFAADPVLPIITNLVALQRPGTFFVDVTYDLIDPDSSNGVYVLAEASSDNGTNYAIPIRSLSGDLGLVTPGVGKKLVWNAWNDWGRNYTTNARVRLIADDFPSTIGSTNTGNYTTNVSPSTNFAWIPSGAFAMNGPEITYVYLSRGIWMGKFEVTQAEYQSVMSNNPSSFTGNPNRPVESVTWHEATNFCAKLTELERAAGRISTNWIYRLPTEAEWEYACRAGTTNTYCFGEDPFNNRLSFYAWYSVNSGGQPHEVGSRAPNRWGLYDMHGSVQEWCEDWYTSFLPGGNVTDPKGPNSSLSGTRVLRGGSWIIDASYARSANRHHAGPTYRGFDCGFRVVFAPAP